MTSIQKMSMREIQAKLDFYVRINLYCEYFCWLLEEKLKRMEIE